MRPYRTAASLGILILMGGPGFAQPAPARRPQPAADSPSAPGAPVDLDATRKRFDANAARTADHDRKMDAKLKRSMGSICAGCEAASPAKRSRAARPAPPTPEDETSPAE